VRSANVNTSGRKVEGPRLPTATFPAEITLCGWCVPDMFANISGCAYSGF